MDVWRDWAETHWAGLGVTVSIVGALTLSIILAIAFNVIVTRHDRVHGDAATGAPPISDALSRG